MADIIDANTYPAVFGKIQARRIALDPLSKCLAAMHFPFSAYATLDSTINLTSGRDNINLRDVALSWIRGDTWLAQAKLHGRLRKY